MELFIKYESKKLVNSHGSSNMVKLSKQLALRSAICTFYSMNKYKPKPKAYVWHHFSKSGITRMGLYKMIANFEKSGSLEHAPVAGCPKVLNEAQVEDLVEKVNHKTSVSIRKLANDFNVAKSTIGKHLKNEGVSYRRRKRAPKAFTILKSRGLALSNDLRAVSVR